jgi:O-antigen/teichoic acid export membrane protein
MLVAGLLCAASLTIVANPLLPAVFGSSFRESADLLRILALAVPLRYLSGSASAVLAATDRIATRVRIQALSAALNIALCFAMIPALEARGAAIATVITEAFLAVALIVAVRAQMVDADVMRETRGWLLLLPAAALLAAAVSHLPEWTIVLSGVVALGSLAVIAGPLKYLGSFSLPLPTRPPENEGRVVT